MERSRYHSVSAPNNPDRVLHWQSGKSVDTMGRQAHISRETLG
ncbi:hypothetical protein [uncultured Lactobacillus sp.]|nr:hypothetical protein [uncultured Lactobacillus sp.]